MALKKRGQDKRGVNEEMKSKIRMCVSQFQVFDDEMAAFAKQLGITNIQLNTPTLPGEKIWDFDALKNLRDRIESHGLKLVMIENVPLVYYDKVILGLPGRDEQLENYIQTIRNLASLGVEIFGHHFSASFVWRTDMEAVGRGGARSSEFDFSKWSTSNNACDGLKELMKRKRHFLDYDVFEVASGLTEEDMFRNYEYFMNAVIPVAEECNIKLALHPDDPPIKEFNGYVRLIASKEDYERAMNIANSPMWGANLCLGCCSEVNGADSVKEYIKFLGERGKLFAVHFRDVIGTLPVFRECFLGEGNFEPPEIMKMLIDYGFDGLIMEDHVPKMDYDSAYCHRARAHELGYMKGLIDTLNYVG